MAKSHAKKIVFGDAFAGCGGLSLGLLQAGLRGRFAIEHDKFAFATLQKNLLSRGAKYRYSWPRWLPEKAIAMSTILKEYGSELESLQGTIDVLVGGPPCQGFSTAGRRRHSVRVYIRRVRKQMERKFRQYELTFDPNCILVSEMTDSNAPVYRLIATFEVLHINMP